MTAFGVKAFIDTEIVPDWWQTHNQAIFSHEFFKTFWKGQNFCTW